MNSDEKRKLAEELLARFERDARSDGAFETLCAEHVELAQELRELRRSRATDSGDAPSPAAVDPDSPLGRLLERLHRKSGDPRYSPLDEIARGGMGVIHRAWDEELDREVAMKVVRFDAPGSGSRESRSLGRFLEEAQLTGQLVHPGIVPVHELGVDESGAPYFTMQLVKGRELGEVFRLVWKGDPEWSRTRALVVIQRVCEAMAYAHSKDIIHRDLKPGNVMVGRFGQVYVMDWGLARLLGKDDALADRLVPDPAKSIELTGVRQEAARETPDSPLLTQYGDVIGTPAYMPPEQARGDIETMDRRADVYAVGAMLYELLTGRMPYSPPDGRVPAQRVLVDLLEGPPPTVAELAPDVSGELAAITAKAMQREPEHRYADMAELAADLSAYLEGRVVRSYESGAWAEARKWLKRNRGVAASFAAVLVTLLLALGAVAWVQAKGREAATAERNLARAAELAANESESRAQDALAEAEAARVEAESLSADLEFAVSEMARPFPVAVKAAFLRDSASPEPLLPHTQLQLNDRIVLEVRSALDVNLYIFNHDDSGLVVQIFPLEGFDLQNPLRSGESYRIPEGFEWEVTSPSSTERFLLLALPADRKFDRDEWGLREFVAFVDEDGPDESTRGVGTPQSAAPGKPMGRYPLAMFKTIAFAADTRGGGWVRLMEYGSAGADTR